MVFRIEDNQNIDGNHREYEIPFQSLPVLKMKEFEKYLAEQIRKEINNSQDRNLLSYSKALGVCLLKYNKFTDNELHINTDIDSVCGYIYFYYLKNQKLEFACEPFDLMYGLYGLDSKKRERDIIVLNFNIDVSDNYLLDGYLRKMTGTGRKKVASPEKDKEVLVMQSPNDMVISDYLDSVYLLYALVLRFGMKKSVYENLYYRIQNLEDYRFECCGEIERKALLTIIEYLYYYGKDERIMIEQILQDSQNNEHLSTYYDPILQLLGIQEESFEDSFMLGDYNSNIVSEWIWYCYSQYM